MAVAAARLLTLPKTLWEFDEVLFIRGVEKFDPLHHRPHPPGYPVVVGLGKLFAAVLGSPFAGLVASSVLASLVGYLALVDAYAHLATAGPDSRRPFESTQIGVLGALLFCFAPPMLLYGPLALSDAPAIAFLALALAAAARLARRDEAAGGVADPSQPTAATAADRRAVVAALALGAFAAAAVGCRPQLAVAVGPMLMVALVLARRRSAWVFAGAGFAVVALAWLAPLVIACGGPRELLHLLRGQANEVATVDALSARAGSSRAHVLVRFVAHPWGPKALALPVLLLATWGMVVSVRQRRFAVLPVLVLAGVDLAFALAVMDPSDAVRYALPSMLSVAFLAAVGAQALAHRLALPAVSWVLPAALCIAFAVYTGPLLRVRTTTASPPVQAIEWAATHVPRGALVLVDPPLAPHAAELLGKRDLALADAALSRLETADDRPAYLLSDGKSRWPGAVSFQWPRMRAWRKLTRGYYRVVSWSPLPTDCRYAARSGVYSWENGWRWLDRQAEIRIPGGSFPSSLGLEFALPPEVPYDGATVEVSGGAGGPVRVRVPRGRRARVALGLPSQPEIDLRVSVDHAFVPAAIGLNTDRRSLAVQLIGCDRGPKGSP